MSVEHVDLLLRVHSIPDPEDVTSWTLDGGRRPTDLEVAMLRAVSRQDIDDWETLVHLAGELKRAIDGTS